MEKILRDYQINSIELIKEEFKKGFNKVMLVLPTGAGKSVIACEMIKRSVKKGNNVIFVVRGVSLINQMSQTLFREYVDHGVIQSNHWNKRPNSKVQIVSIDTIISRKNYPKADFIIIDEVDQATSKGYKEFLSKYNNSFILGVTATPFFIKPITHAVESYVAPISMQGLIDKNYLCPFKYYAPNVPDLSEVKVSSSTKDYVNDQLEEVMVQGSLTGEIIKHWKSLGQNRPTLCFAVNVKHSKILVERFNKSGIPAAHCDANTPQNERDEIFLKLKNGEIKIVCNVGIATRGFDAPYVSCLIIARPTKSLNLHIQILGRGTRLHDGKENCLVLDHAGNIQQHGFPTDEREINLYGKATETFTKTSKICKECFAVYRGPICPECGVKAPPAPQGEIVETDEQLQEITQQNFIEITLKNLIREAKQKGRKKQWAYYKLIDRFGIEKVKDLLPPTFADRYENGIKNVFKNSYMRGFNG